MCSRCGDALLTTGFCLKTKKPIQIELDTGLKDLFSNTTATTTTIIHTHAHAPAGYMRLPLLCEMNQAEK